MAQVSHDVPPEKVAGGGQPSAAGASTDIMELTDGILKHLKAIHARFSSKETSSVDQVGVSMLRDTQGLGPADAALRSTGDLTLSDFLAYMTSPDANALGPLPEGDLSQPLSNYFISSSHNTYLSGHQLYGQASVEPYKNVLLRGCRCIEIDVWNGDEDSPAKTPPTDSEKKRWFNKRSTKSDVPDENAIKELTLTESETLEKPKAWSASAKPEPRVLHGYTLTKEVSFRDVCVAIREAAFVTSDLPVIVSLEVHASLEQQEMMVDIMNSEWHNLLLEQDEVSDSGAMPSPEQLRGKILVKVKYVPEKKDGEELSLEPSRRSSTSSEEASKGEKKKKKPFLQSLSKMGVWTRACHFSNFDQPESNMPGHVFSLSENNFIGLSEAHRASAFKHNRNFLMRIYPFGLRVTSSNLDPSIFWRGGVQMVALNWQKCDQGMMLNEAMFAETSGWVLKPDGYRGSSEAVQTALDARRKTLNLKITLLAAQYISIPLEDSNDKSFRPYIKCELHNESSERRHGEDEKKEKAKRSELKHRSKTHRGVSPDLGGEVFEFKDVPGILDELTFVRFKVQDDEIGKDDLAAWACIRLDRFRKGYRMLRLLDASGKMSKGVVLIHIDKQLS